MNTCRICKIQIGDSLLLCVKCFAAHLSKMISNVLDIEEIKQTEKLICQSCGTSQPSNNGKWIKFEGEDIWVCNSCLEWNKLC